MRRISLALALLGAAAAGCGGGATSSTGGARGVAEGTFTVTVQNGQGQVRDPVSGFLPLEMLGGRVTSADSNINCYAGSLDGCSFDFPNTAPVTLTATPDAGLIFLGWAGDCIGETATCTLSGKSDKYVLARFGTEADRASHGNFSASSVHGPAYLAFYQGQPGALQCTTCHGANLQGQGIALSCSSCHNWPLGDHFNVTAAFDDHTSGWSQACQRCHTDEGFRDYIGEFAAPTEAGVPSDNHLGTTFRGTNANTTCVAATVDPVTGVCVDTTRYMFGPLKCSTCHNSVSEPVSGAGLTTVRFPSSGNGVVLNPTATAPSTTSVENPLGLVVVNTVDRSTGLCAQCHQGRESTTSVNTRIMSAPNPSALDAVIGTGTFINPHYLGAAGTLFGTDGKMWAEYPGMIYTGRMEHGGKASCTFCHDAHTGHLPADAEIRTKCGACHFNEAGAAVSSLLELEEVRQFGYEGDIDGDGVEEPLKDEIEGLEVPLYDAIKAYAQDVVGTCIVYDGASHPYYFIDADCDGVRATTDTTGYNAFTPRLLRAAFNNKWAHAEPGAWAHNPRYAIEILFDAITDLNAGLTADGSPTIPFAGKRAFNGHFGAAEDASAYSAMVYHSYAPMGFTSAACYQCHGGKVGFAQYLANPLGSALTTAGKVTAMQCSTCHVDGEDMTGIRDDVATLYFPPQKNPAAALNPNQVSFAAADLPSGFIVCATCHSGRENGTSVDNAIATNYGLSATGLVATGGSTTSVEVAAPAAWAANRYRNARVDFTSGALAGTAVIVQGPSAAVLSGATATLTWTAALPSAPAAGDTFDVTFDAETWGVGFTNPHYLGAAGVLMGSTAHVMYQYEGQTYQGLPVNWAVGDAAGPHGSPHGARCTGCHQPKGTEHTFEIDTATTVVIGDYHGVPNTQACDGCHIDATAFGAGDYRLAPKKLEVEEAAAELYTAIQAYAAADGFTICYNGASHPYWFADDDSDGTCSTAVQARLDARTAKAAFNFKWAHAEPGAYAHNLEYMMQALYDSIVDVGGTPSFTRP